MIAYIKGNVVAYDSENVIIDNHGIGYRIIMANATSLVVGEEVKIYTYLQIREDAHVLFGFNTIKEHELFLKLISVKGIGPKIAINALSNGGVDQIINAVENSDATYLKSLPGIGAKAASQIVLDLKGKLVESVDVSKNNNKNLNDAIEGLKGLGYKSSEINGVIKEISKKDASVDEYIKHALKLLLKQKGV